MNNLPDKFEDQLTEIFVKVDDFCQDFREDIAKATQKMLSGDKKTRNRKSKLSESEVISILIGFHLGTHKSLKGYYINYIQAHYRHLFPNLLSYNRFVEIQKKSAIPFMLFLKHCCMGECTGINFIDSTKLRVCNNKRIKRNKVFKNIAERGMSSMGWFFGFKLHLIINDKGELMSFYLTKGNVDDRNVTVCKSMTKSIFGKLFGDKGYISKSLFNLLFKDGIQLVTSVKKNMKNHLMSLADKILLRKRSLIETVNDELKNMCQIEHSRHRSVNNFLINVIGALAAYSFFPKKPSLNIHKAPSKQLCLTVA